MSTLYPKKNPEDFPALYAAHISAMTTEDLRRKSDIAIQLAWRDAEIERLRALLPKPDTDGWINWPGGFQPVADGTTVQVQLHMVSSTFTDTAENFRWDRKLLTADVVAYRVVEWGAAPKTDDDGWIAWAGGPRPVAFDTIVEVRMRDGSVSHGMAGRDFRWRLCGAFFDIVAYRVISEPRFENAQYLPTTTSGAAGWIAWHGGACPVPVDTKVEVRLRNGSLDQGDAVYFYWDHDDIDDDIVAYRIIQEAP